MGRSVNFQDELTKRTDEIEKGIREFLPKEEGFAKSMAQAMNYSMLAGGKRLRPLLMQETYRLFGGKEKVIWPFMTGMEMIHTHSLIHDDLPALDNDDYRRGRLTTHKVYGEAMGILSGVALLNYAYETMLLAFERTAYPERVIRGLSVMAEKTGIHGMLGGQSVDVENDGTPLTKEMLDYIYRNKTSALIEAAMMTGAILAGADENSVAIIEEAAGKIGLAFQIQDDILDVTSTEEELGKPVHSDEKNNKVTYVTLFGIEEASRQVKELSEDAVSLLKGLNKNNEFLYLLVEKLINRRK
jgi:geranylgeranyl diphosphate synthase type II